MLRLKTVRARPNAVDVEDTADGFTQKALVSLFILIRFYPCFLVCGGREKKNGRRADKTDLMGGYGYRGVAA